MMKKINSSGKKYQSGLKSELETLQDELNERNQECQQISQDYEKILIENQKMSLIIKDLQDQVEIEMNKTAGKNTLQVKSQCQHLISQNR